MKAVLGLFAAATAGLAGYGWWRGKRYDRRTVAATPPRYPMPPEEVARERAYRDRRAAELDRIAEDVSDDGGGEAYR